MPEVTECICIEKPFYNSFLLSLPQWFCYGWDCHLNWDCHLEKFPVYLQSRTEMFYFVFEELRWYKLKKRPVYSSKVMRFESVFNPFLTSVPLTCKPGS